MLEMKGMSREVLRSAPRKIKCRKELFNKIFNICINVARVPEDWKGHILYPYKKK